MIVSYIKVHTVYNGIIVVHLSMMVKLSLLLMDIIQNWRI